MYDGNTRSEEIAWSKSSTAIAYVQRLSLRINAQAAPPMSTDRNTYKGRMWRTPIFNPELIPTARRNAGGTVKNKTSRPWLNVPSAKAATASGNTTAKANADLIANPPANEQ